MLTPADPFEIVIEDGVYVVSGERIERLAAMTDFESDEALGRFEAVLARIGVDKRLRELGARDGDTVRIAGNEFDYLVTKERLGLFGGTFDPVHNAHLFVAEGAREELGLDRVALFAAATDRAIATPRRRRRPANASTMLRLAIAGQPRLRDSTRATSPPRRPAIPRI